MSSDPLFAALTAFTATHGVQVRVETMDDEVAATFDGLGIALSPRHDRESQCYYLVHSFGSIVGWSLNLGGTQALFEELRGAKETKDSDPERFARALQAFCDFEERASEYAVAILDDVGHHAAIHPYTIFFRADAASMTIFHRQGHAPPWTAFLAEWKARVASGAQVLQPYAPRPVPTFTPMAIPRQEVLREVDGAS